MDGLPSYTLLKGFYTIKCYQKFFKKLLTLISWSFYFSRSNETNIRIISS